MNIFLATLFLAAAPDFSLGPLQIDARGYIQDDFRLVLAHENGNGEPQGDFVRNEASIFGRLDISAGEHVTGVASIRPVYTGIAQVSTFSDLQSRQQIDPFWVELYDAYLEIHDFGTSGLDLKLGRQSVVWGVSDQFNPTNVLNARDFYDPLTFGQPFSNQMIVLRYQTPIALNFEGVFIPVFRPARLPPEAPSAFNGPLPLAYNSDKAALAKLQQFEHSFGAFGPITNTLDLQPQLPATTISNSMAGFKVGGQLADVDLSLSYVYGRWDLPTPQTLTPTFVINPGPGGGIGSVTATTPVTLVYPKMQVFGFDASTSLDKLGGIGVWAEVALTLPQGINFTIVPPALLTTVYGKVPCPPSAPCASVTSQPFVKATLGADYNFTKWLYLNLQYLRGFVDEFGAQQLQNYLVAAMNIKPFGDLYVFQFAGVLDLNDGSQVIYPSFILKAYSGVELTLGALIFGGTPDQKFGGPQNGSTQVFLRGRLSF